MNIKKQLQKKELELQSKAEQYNNTNKLLQEMMKEILILNGEVKALKELIKEEK